VGAGLPAKRPVQPSLFQTDLENPALAPGFFYASYLTALVDPHLK